MTLTRVDSSAIRGQADSCGSGNGGLRPIFYIMRRSFRCPIDNNAGKAGANATHRHTAEQPTDAGPAALPSFLGGPCCCSVLSLSRCASKQKTMGAMLPPPLRARASETDGARSTRLVRVLARPSGWFLVVRLRSINNVRPVQDPPVRPPWAGGLSPRHPPPGAPFLPWS